MPEHHEQNRHAAVLPAFVRAGEFWELANQSSRSSLAYAVFVVIGVTLPSLTYRFFAMPSEGRRSTLA